MEVVGRDAEVYFRLGIGIMDRLGGLGAGTSILLGVSRPDIAEYPLAAEDVNVGDRARCKKEVEESPSSDVQCCDGAGM